MEFILVPSAVLALIFNHGYRPLEVQFYLPCQFLVLSAWIDALSYNIAVVDVLHLFGSACDPPSADHVVAYS